MLAYGFGNENLNMMTVTFSFSEHVTQAGTDHARNQPRPPPHPGGHRRPGIFCRGARQLNLAAPTISLHVAELEARIGAPLLGRARGQVRPTAIGETLLARARRLLADATWRWTKCAVRLRG